MISKKRKLFLWTVRGGMYLATALTAGLTLFLMVYVLAKGIPNITWELLSTKPSYLADRIGILPDILNTLYIIIYTLILVLPLGVGAAIYLTEYAHNKKVVAVIEYAAETLSGIPSIIYGLVGMLLFSNNMGTSLLAGALTLVIMNLPTIMRNTQESLKTVPRATGRARSAWARESGGSSARWCFPTAWTESSPAASFPSAAFWVSLPRCCSPPDLPMWWAASGLRETALARH